MADKKGTKFLTFKGKPLVRCGDTIYYGNIGDPYVIVLTVLSTDKVQELDVATRVSIELMRNDPESKIVRKAEKRSFFEAIQLGYVWLDRALAQ